MSSVVDRSRSVCLVLLTVIVAEAAIGSSGRWLVIGPLSIRVILLGACLLAGLPLLWRERRFLLGEGIVWVTSLFVVSLAASALWAFHLGNSPSFIVNDLTTFSAVLLVPTVVAMRLSAAEVGRLLTVLFVSATGLAVITVLIHLMVPHGLLDPDATADWLTDRSLGGLADVGGGVYRIYLRSQIMFIPALIIGLHRVGHAERHRVLWMAGSSALATGLVISLSRSLWIGFVVALVATLVWYYRDLLSFAKALAVAALGTIVLVGLSTAVYSGPALVTATVQRLDPSLVVIVPGSDAYTADEVQESEGDSTADEDSVVLRGQTLELTREKVRERPVTGWGIGYNLDAIRSDGRTEYMYWDMLMKVGVVGMVPFVLLYTWLPLLALRPGRSGRATDARLLAAGLLGIAAASYFNPFLNSTLGIVILLLLVASVGSARSAAGRGADVGSSPLSTSTAPPG